MQFLIDYENTGGDGLKGVSHLVQEDAVTLFYSNSANQVEKGLWHQMCAAGCNLQICKLVQCRKNALDFYIASFIGEEFGKGYRGKIGIVSRDKGFLAVCDFWQQRNDINKTVIAGESIERCILHANENNERTKSVREQLKKVRIEEGYTVYSADTNRKRAVQKLLRGGPYEKYSEEICDLQTLTNGNRKMYLSLLRQYGKVEGLNIYRLLKNSQISSVQ